MLLAVHEQEPSGAMLIGKQARARLKTVPLRRASEPFGVAG